MAGMYVGDESGSGVKVTASLSLLTRVAIGPIAERGSGHQYLRFSSEE